MKKSIIVLLGIGFAVAVLGIALLYTKSHGARKMTFEECTNAGGVAWRVDLYDPEICSSCAAYQACQEQNTGRSDIREACPQVVACVKCLEKNSPYPNTCPGGKDKMGEISDAEIWFQCCQ
jgi:hypothetical protein